MPSQTLPAGWSWADDAAPAQEPARAPAPAPPAVPAPPRRPAEFGGAPAPKSDLSAVWSWVEPAAATVGSVAKEPMKSGLREGPESATAGVNAVARQSLDKNVAEPKMVDGPDARILSQNHGEGWQDPKWWVGQMTRSVAGGWPSLALGAAGAGAGGAVAGPPGALVGGVGGFAGGSALQTIAPAYKRALDDGLNHDAAVDRAMKETGIAAAFGGAMAAAPEVKILKQPISDALLTIFGKAPAFMAGQRAHRTLSKAGGSARAFRKERAPLTRRRRNVCLR